MAGLGAGSSPAQGGQQQQQSSATGMGATPISAAMGLPSGVEAQLKQALDYQKGIRGNSHEWLANMYQNDANKAASAGYTRPDALPDPDNVLGGQFERFNSGRWPGALLRQTPQGMANQQTNIANLLGGRYNQVYADPYGGLPANTRMAGQQGYQWNLPNAQPGQFASSFSQLNPQGYAMTYSLPTTNNRFGPFRPGG